jgi:hypothetical protein
MEIKQEDLKTKGELIWTERKVPQWAISLEKLGFYNIVKKVSPIISQKKYTNLVCTIGKQTVVDRWCGTITKTGILTYLALGSGTPIAVGDIKLTTEVYRKLLTTRVRSGTIAQTSTYIPTNEGNGTHKEVGLFGDDATAVADSGTLYTHVAIDEVKTNGISVTVDYNLEIT